MVMTKQEYLKQVWQNEKEWDYNLQIAYVFKNIINDTNPIIRAMKKSADMILEADNIRKSDYEIETEDEIITESLEEKIDKANKILKYDVHGSNTRAYYYDNRKKCKDTVNHQLIITLFRQCLWDEDRSVFSNVDYRITLYFIEAGCRWLKFK